MANSLKGIPSAQIRDLAVHLLRSGADPDQVVDEIVSFLDSLVDDSAIVGDELGPLLEAVDGPLLRIGVRLVVHLVVRRLGRGASS